MSVIYRKDVPRELTWDLSLIYPTEEAFLADVEKIKALVSEIVAKYKGKLKDADMVNECLDQYQTVMELINLGANYTELATSVDYYDSKAQQLNDRMMSTSSQAESELSFIEDEIAALPEKILKEAIKKTKTNKGLIGDILLEKPHRLSAETEKVLAALGSTFQTPYQIYNMSKMADMNFGSFQAEGKEYPLGYALYENNYSYEEDTAVRREAAKKFYEKLSEYENVTAAAYNSQVVTEKNMSVIRGYENVFESLLAPQKVSIDMYNRQIDVIMEELAPHMRKYAKLLQKIHGLDRMTYADLKLPVDPDYSPKVTISEAKKMIMEGLSCLGEDYLSMIDEAFEKRWIDFAKNQGKSTGGFCSSPYGKGSFILMSYNEKMSDVFTLAHELGHAGHFRLCNAAQSIADTDVSTYFVESPSTMNELIMTHYMLRQNEDPRYRRFVLASMVSNTYYHNFVTHLLEAAYQREVYRIVDDGGSVQAETLSKIFREVLEKFWGDAVEIEEGAELTWMRQPHYYMGLYPYTYSAGLTIATQMCLRIEREGQPAVDDWKKVLAAGSTKTPMELAQMAGVDISTDKPLRDTIAYIGGMIDEICKLTEELM